MIPRPSPRIRSISASAKRLHAQSRYIAQSAHVSVKATPHISHFSKRDMKNSRQERREHRLVFKFNHKGALNQTDSVFLSARYRFANANMIFSLAVCFRRPRYRVFRYWNSRFTIAKTCSTLHLTDDFSCSLFLA